MVEKVIFNCETITPMFCYGANQNEPEIRATSIKGILRFWWRAINSHLSLKELKERETEIFGGASENALKSSFSIRVKDVEKIEKFDQSLWNYYFRNKNKDYNVKGTKNGNEISVNLFDYIAYGGIITYNKQEKKNLLNNKGLYSIKNSFQIILNYKNGFKKEFIQEIEKTVKALMFFGGVGTKSRNGFGKIAFNNQTINIGNIELFYKELKKDNDYPDYTAFSKYARLYKTKTSYDSWVDAFFEIGKAYREARLSIEAHHTYSLRKYIASPLIVDGRNKADYEHHSKQYFLNVFREDDKYIGYILHLPYNYGKLDYTSAFTKLNKKLSGLLIEVK